MLEVKVNVPEIKSFINEIVEAPGKIFNDIVRYNVKESVSDYLNDLMKMELTLFLGRKRYEHQKGQGKNYRNGSYYRRFTIKGIGEIEVQIPKDRQGEFNSR